MGRSADLTGQRFGKLTVEKYIGHGKYHCVCDCGNEKDVFTGKLNAGEVKSCGCLKDYDLAGMRFGRLYVKAKCPSYRYENGTSIAKYLCVCDCGNEVKVLANALRSGRTTSCGCFRKEQVRKAVFKDLTGKRFGRWTVVSYYGVEQGKTYWNCKCECGAERKVKSDSLTSGLSLSCGCLKDEVATTHGKSKTRIYRIWIGMRRRCYDPNQRSYARYGGRRIRVCQEWEESFVTFYEWAIANDYSDKKSIDRIDNDGNYCPENCRWVTSKVQGNNRSSNVRYTYDGISHSVMEWSEIAGLPYATLAARIKAGWVFEDAIKTPVDMKYSHRKKVV